MLHSLTLFGGFVCTEGQASANAKQLIYTLGIAVVLSVLIWLVHRRWHSRALLITLSIISLLFVVIAAAFGPIFYSDWGCENMLFRLLGNNGY